MTAIQMSTSTRGMAALRRKLREVFPLTARDVLEGTVELVRGEVKQRMRPHPVDKGSLANTLKTSIAPPGRPLQGSVFTAAPIAKKVEIGRPTGDAPSVGAIGRWADRHGIATDPWELQRRIRTRGTRGVKFMQKGAKEARTNIDPMLARVRRKTVRRWRR